MPPHEECLSSEQTERVPDILTKVLIPLVDPIRATPYLELDPLTSFRPCLLFQRSSNPTPSVVGNIKVIE